MSMLFHDLRIAIRHLQKSPGFTATAVLMLALGIGTTTAIFSIVESVLLRPLPFPHPERLVLLNDIIEGADVGGNGEAGVTAPDIQAYARDTHSFESLGGFSQTTFELSGVGEPAQVAASRLSGGVFPALQVAPLLGRFFTQPEDDQKEPVTLLSYSLWRERFRGDPGVLGTKVLLDRKPYVVIGVMPRNFEFPLVPGHFNNSQLWVPVSFTEVELTSGAAGWNFGMVGRLKPGITPAQAGSDAGRVAEETMRNYPAFMSSIRIRPVVRSFHEETVEQARELLRTLFLATGVVLLIACANLAGLLLVRAIRRRREIAVRLALGARATVLLRQAILESLVLSASGGVLGLVLASIALRLGVSYLPDTLPRIREIGLDWQVVSFALLLAGLTGVVCGLAPAFAALRTSVNDTLKEGGRTGTSGGHGWLRSALVVGEIAIALTLLFASGLLLRSFEKMRTVNLGFRPDHILSAVYALPQKQYATQAAVNEFNDELLRRLRQLPGVASAGLTSFLPASGNINNNTFVAEGYVPPPGANMNLATLVTVSGDYLQTMGIPLLGGRFFNQADASNPQLVTIVNHKLAEHYWHGSDPIGKRLRLGTPEMQTPWLTVVGVVADVKEGSPDAPAKEQGYQPVEQFEKSLGSLASPADPPTGNGGFIVARTRMEPDQMASALRAAVRSLDPQLPLTQVQSMEYTVNDSEAPRRFNTALISAFAIAAVLLAALGIYSVIAFSADLRAQEMAIRMALGSQRAGILGLVFKSAVKLALAGCVAGLLGAGAASHLLQSFLFGVSRFDPAVLLLAAVFVFLLALVASWLPARRAASINPMNALRAD
jgi:putative ABC transport system permease protein